MEEYNEMNVANEKQGNSQNEADLRAKFREENNTSNETFEPSNPISFKKKKKGKAAILITLLCILLLGSGTFAYAKFFQRDVNLLIFGEQKYAINLESKTMESMSTNFQNMVVLMLKENTRLKSTKTDFKAQLKADDSLLKYASDNMGPDGSKLLQDVISFINTLSVSTNQTTNDNGSKFDLIIKESKGDFLTVNGWMDKNNLTVQMPEIMNKYIQIPMKSNLKPTDVIKIDSAKLKISLSNIVKVYVDNLADSKVSVMENQTVSIQNVTVNGKKITMTLTQEQLRKLAKAVVNAIRDDKYLQELVVSNTNNVVEYYKSAQIASTLNSEFDKITVDTYKEWCNKLIDEIEKSQSTSEELKINSYLSPSNKLLAKTFEVSSSDKKTDSLVVQLLTPSEGGLAAPKAFSIVESGKSGLSVVQTPTSITDGNIKIFVYDDASKKTFGAKIDYKNVVKLPWGGADLITGNFTVSLLDPSNDIAKSIDGNELFAQITKSTVEFNYSINKETLVSDLKLSLKGIGEIKINSSTSILAAKQFEMPAINDSNSYKIDPTNTTNSDSLLKMSTEMQTGLIKHLVTIAKRNTDFANILAGLGMPIEALEGMVG